MVEGLCFKCKKKVGISAPKEISLKNNRKAVSGTCPVCNAKVYTFAGRSTEVRATNRNRK
jgi:hypothetical protein